jgi:hypothetical protein
MVHDRTERLALLLYAITTTEGGVLPRRTGLSLSIARYNRQRGSACGQMQEFAAGKFDHDAPLEVIKYR